MKTHFALLLLLLLPSITQGKHVNLRGAILQDEPTSTSRDLFQVVLLPCLSFQQAMGWFGSSADIKCTSNTNCTKPREKCLVDTNGFKFDCGNPIVWDQDIPLCDVPSSPSTPPPPPTTLPPPPPTTPRPPPPTTPRPPPPTTPPPPPPTTPPRPPPTVPPPLPTTPSPTKPPGERTDPVPTGPQPVPKPQPSSLPPTPTPPSPSSPTPAKACISFEQAYGYFGKRAESTLGIHCTSNANCTNPGDKCLVESNGFKFFCGNPSVWDQNQPLCGS